jgi:ribosomal protein S18 acetylase RimI-like enzyme
MRIMPGPDTRLGDRCVGHWPDDERLTTCDDYAEMMSISEPVRHDTATVYVIVPIARRHIAGFQAALDSVAREGNFLAIRAAPSATRTRRVVLDSLAEGAVHVVALQQQEVVGWCDIRPKSASTLRHSGVLGMGVVRAHRRRGLGARMLAMALEMAGEHGLRRVELIVRADNAAAIALYQRFGFEVEGTLRRYMCIDDTCYDALLMARLDGPR